MYKLSGLLATLFLLESASAVLGQLVKGSFGLVTSDPISIQCRDARVQWHGGIPPYVLSVSGYHNSYGLTNVGTTQTNQMKWRVNFPSGTQLWFQLLDANGTDIYTNIVTVAPSTDASCVNVTNPLVTDPSTSTTSGSATSLGSTSTESATVTGASSQMPSSHNVIAPIVGGIAGGIAALLLILFCLLWLKQRNKRRMATLDTKQGLDLNEGSYMTEPFTIQSTGISNPVGRTPKMATTSASNLISPRLDYSGSGTSMPTTSGVPPSSSTQSIQDESPTTRPSQSPTALRKETRTGSRPRYDGSVQEQDAGVSLSGGLQVDGHTTLPPAYDSSWRT